MLMITPVLRKLRTAASLIRKNPRELVRRAAGQYDRWVVFSACAAELPPPDPSEELLFRKLTEAELQSAMDLPWLTPDQIAEFRNMQFNGAYGVYASGQLAHICWLIRAANEHEGSPVGLLEDEAQITFCVTKPDVRGRGVYPFAIRSLSQLAARSGVRQIFMKASKGNTASHRGIEKAGFHRCGEIIAFTAPYLLWRSVVYKTFRKRAPQPECRGGRA